MIRKGEKKTLFQRIMIYLLQARLYKTLCKKKIFSVKNSAYRFKALFLTSEALSIWVAFPLLNKEYIPGIAHASKNRMNF